MRRSFFNLSSLLLVAIVTPVITLACSSEENASNEEESGSGSKTSGGKAGKGGSGGKGGGGKGGSAGKGGSSKGGSAGSGEAGSIAISDPTLLSITVSPPTASFTVTGGVASPPSAVFQAKGSTADGDIALGEPSWSVDRPSLATIDAAGKLTPTGKEGGLVVVTAEQKGVKGEAQVTIKLLSSSTVGDAPVSDDDKNKLKGAAGPDPSAKLSYPYDQTVFPPGILPPTLMWSGGAPDDLYMARLTSLAGEVEVFGKAPDQRLAIPEQAWSDLLRDSKGHKVQMTLARLSQGNAAVVTTQTWPVATGPLRGTVYYWSNNLGRVLRIKPGAKQPDDFLAAAGVTDGCTTCHTVSAKGNVMVLGGAKESGDSNAAIYDLAGNSLTRTADQGYGRSWAMPALSPDGHYAVLNDGPLPGGPGKGGGLFDVASAQLVPGTALDGFPVDMPYFSADGSALVYVDHGSKGLAAFDYNQGALPGAFSNKRDLVPQAGPAGNADTIAFPAATPDGKWAVYHRGSLDTRYGPGDLFLASTTQPGVEVALDNLNGKNYPFAAGERDRHMNYEPTFAPLPAGGYFWVIFTSRRTYGNLRVGPGFDDPKDSGNGTKLLWLAAIDMHPEPGKDPSHPAILLQGQDIATLNMRAFWVFEPCKANGEGCEFGSDCCEGFCEPAKGSAALACGGGDIANPKPCEKPGSKCLTADDCCQAAGKSECINGFCSDPPPKIE